jgi:hypothetical protein
VKEPIEGEFRVVGEKRPPEHFISSEAVGSVIEFVATWVVFIALMALNAWVALKISRLLFPTGPL